MNDHYDLIYKPPVNSEPLPHSLRFLEDSETVTIDPSAEYECEYGTCGNVEFANATMHDGEGKEIEIPKCHICDAYMSMAIGKESFVWLCHQGCK